MGVTTYTNFGGRIVSENRNGVKSDYLADTLGNTAALVNATGITDTWNYWPNGEVAARTGTNPTPFTFGGTLGYRQDVLNNLDYVRARHLRPGLARWQTVDPLWPRRPVASSAWLSPSSLAAYGYGRNAPEVNVDWTGKAPANPGTGNCTVKVCSMYGWNNIVVTHQYVCATTYGGKNCNGSLEPGSGGKGGGGHFGGGFVDTLLAPCNSTTKYGFPIVCDTRSVDCSLASAMCICLKALRAKPPKYFLGVHQCWDFKHDVDNCMCDLDPSLCSYPLGGPPATDPLWGN